MVWSQFFSKLDRACPVCEGIKQKTNIFCNTYTRSKSEIDLTRFGNVPTSTGKEGAKIQCHKWNTKDRNSHSQPQHTNLTNFSEIHHFMPNRKSNNQKWGSIYREKKIGKKILNYLSLGLSTKILSPPYLALGHLIWIQGNLNSIY